MKRTAFLIYVSLLLSCASQVKGADTTIVKSPDGTIAFKLYPRKGGLEFTVTSTGKTIVEPSPLVMYLNGQPLFDHVSTKKTTRYSINRSYPWYGVHQKALDRCQGAKLELVASGLPVTVDIRVYNDGAAFRQVIGGGKKERTPEEATLFNLPAASTIWYHDLDMHYESVHVKKQIDEVKEGEWMAPPATYKLPWGCYASITEADLMDYPGMALQANGKNGLVLRLASDQPTSYPYKLRYSAADTERLRKPAVLSGTITTPWRVVIVGRDLNALVNNDIVHNLNPAPDPKLFPAGIYTPWVRPGRAVWKYLDGGGDGTPEVMKHFTDGAAALGFEHNILEGFWARWTDDQLKDLVRYSKEKGVGIWLWKHSKSLRQADSRDSFFRKCHELGIAGVKIDFFDHEAKEVIDLYEHILEETAKYHLLVDFHGADKPTGLARTFPNEMTREAVKGMEASKLADRATHETTIPFTRFLAGPAEYTVMHFGERKKNTTRTHQVASAAILSAPLLTYAANPDTILASPAMSLIKNIPAVWDETMVLPPSEIGELAVFARRKGDTWFLAVMNGVEDRKIQVPLKFLKGKYKALVVQDKPSDKNGMVVENRVFSSADILNLELVSGGGYIAQFTKDDKVTSKR